MKFTWKHKLSLGLILLVSHFSVTYLMNNVVGTKQSVTEIFFTSLIFSIGMSFIFPLLMRWTGKKLSKKIDSFLPQIISNDEEIKFQDMANLTKGFEKVGGKLLLTNERLLFVSHKFNIQSGITSINPKEIASVEKVKMMIFFDNGLKINMKDNTSHTFVVNERKTWLEKLSTYSQAA